MTSPNKPCSNLILELESLRVRAEESCNKLKAILPSSRVFFASDPSYETQQSSYYTASQGSLTPTCRVLPRGTEEVSKILKLATREEERQGEDGGCHFAVRTGGHMSWSGASNIGLEGFTIDLQGLMLEREEGQGEEHGSDVRAKVSKDNKVVSISAGARWRDVYSVLKPENLSTVGGRVGDVGVGGYSAGPVWGGSQFYSIEQAPKLLDKLVKFTEKLDSDPKAFWGLSMAWNPATKDYIIWTLQTYLKPEPYPPLWDDFAVMVNDSTTKPLADMMGIKNLVDITEEFQEADPGKHGRSRWLSMTYRPNAKFHLDLHAKGGELFEPYHDRPGVHWAVSIQPIPKRFASGQASLTNGGNRAV
ncbi:hypothetical protein D9757_011415 [Collybiopsis confluens]|uniref:FAD linked oxidase N-terminal domain-containing protein n=1 Tax=Collybiopsis confluens TaxID=2823264 RepID=A0A8H5G8K5_9AGAR|nr:hypothetical protein D9757_011415 [Collybiopsis confluens]